MTRSRSERGSARNAAVIVGVVVIGLIAVLATRKSAGERTQRSPVVGRQAPEFSGKSVLDGTAFDLADQRGRYVLLNFFAPWCVPCQTEHAELRAFKDAHAAAGDIAVVALLFPPVELNDVKRFFSARGGDWPVIDNSRAIVDYGVTGIPETFLIGPDGTVLWKTNGGVKAPKLERLLEEAKRAVGDSS